MCREIAGLSQHPRRDAPEELVDELRIFHSRSLPLRTASSLPLRLGPDSSREHFRHPWTPTRCLLIAAVPSHGRSSSGHSSVDFLCALRILPSLFVFFNCRGFLSHRFSTQQKYTEEQLKPQFSADRVLPTAPPTTTTI